MISGCRAKWAGRGWLFRPVVRPLDGRNFSDRGKWSDGFKALAWGEMGEMGILRMWVKTWKRPSREGAIERYMWSMRLVEPLRDTCVCRG